MTVHPPNGTATTVTVARDGEGRFLPGNQLAKGHGGSAHDLARWRRLALESTTEQDMLEVWRTLVACAKAGEPWAVHEFLDRTHGKAMLPAPDPGPDISEQLREMYQSWLRPAEEVYAHELQALREENERLRTGMPLRRESASPTGIEDRPAERVQSPRTPPCFVSSPWRAPLDLTEADIVDDQE